MENCLSLAGETETLPLVAEFFLRSLTRRKWNDVHNHPQWIAIPMIAYRPLTLTDLPAVARIHVDGWRSAYRHFMPAEVFAGQDPAANEADFRQWLTEWVPPAFGFVAESQGQVVGFSMAGKNFEEPAAYAGELYKLFVRPEFHGQGVGQQLLRLTAEALRQAGYSNLVIWCFREGDSARFYAHLDLPVVHTTTITLAGRLCDVLVFGGEVDVLLARLTREVA